MLKEEFIQRTGFNPSDEDYKVIEKEYYEFGGNKDQFCVDWLKNNGIQNLYDKATNRYKDAEQEVLNLRNHIETMEIRIDRMEKWHPAKDTGTNLEQKEYIKMRFSAEEDNKEYKHAEDAIEKIHQLTGMDKDYIRLVDMVKSYEVGTSCRLRVSGEYIRQPIYLASDWNYFRFDCLGWQWEIVNGTLLHYNS